MENNKLQIIPKNLVARVETQLAISNKILALNNQIEMVYVEGGTFNMGAQRIDPNQPNYDSEAEDRESPVHSVSLSSYCIGKYEVTQKQWQDIMGANPSDCKGDDLPVETVSWEDVQEFIGKLNQKTGKKYRLPTEAEWEYAARGGAQSKGYKYSGSNMIDNVARYSSNYGTHAVGTKSANELGIYDMSGNVWEWCSDWEDDYCRISQTNPTGASSGSGCVYRGGSWIHDAAYCRVSHRNGGMPSCRFNDLGFRLVLPL
jgi:formylglycine-generating enzyme required for sulfatase activity